jgi:hypothetical protein
MLRNILNGEVEEDGANNERYELQLFQPIAQFL